MVLLKKTFLLLISSNLREVQHLDLSMFSEVSFR